MLSPALVLAIALATFWGAACHFFLGGNLSRLLRFLLMSWVGFALGQIIGQWLGNDYWTIGMVQAFPGSLGAIVLLSHTVLRIRKSDTSRVR